jgi:hypothetical protein
MADASDKAFREKHMAVQASLDAQDEITIYAAIGAEGPRSSKANGETHWPLCLDVIAWRVPDGPVQRGDLLFDQHVTDTELAALHGAITTESLIAFRAKLCECSHFGDTRARFLGLLTTPHDDKLATILFEYSNPVVMVDPQLGKLIFDKSADEYTGTINWLGKEIRINVAADEHGNAADALTTLKILMFDMAGWTRKVNHFAAAELLGLKNDGWLDEGESPMTHEQFVERMQFDCLSVDPGGAFTFWHLDGGLFCGHYIQICGSLDMGLTNADIPG